MAGDGEKRSSAAAAVSAAVSAQMPVAAAAILALGASSLLMPNLRPVTGSNNMRHPSPVLCDIGVSVNVQVQLDEDGPATLVTLKSAEDPGKFAAELSAQYSLSADEAADLKADLAEQWADASSSAPPIYVGPMVEENQLSNVCCSVELSDVGVALEVADSVAVVDGGRGLFIRCLGDSEAVALEEGTAICGYADGQMQPAPNSDGGKTVAFALASTEASVWFEQALHSVGDLLADDSIDRIAGHVAQYDETGRLAGVALDADYQRRYFVPSEASANPPGGLTIGGLGQMANDLAVASICADDASATLSEEDCQVLYEEASSDANLLVLVFRLERDAEDPRVLVPTRPISTLSRSITFINDVPMELGCSYGGRYWRNRRNAAALQASLELDGSSS